MSTEDETQNTAENQDVETLLSTSNVITLVTGQEVEVQRLKTLETLSLLKILSVGAGDVLSQTNFSLDMDPEEFTGIFVGSVLLSIPEAQKEVIGFLQQVTVPVGLIKDPKSVPETEVNQKLWTDLFTALENPEIDDTFSILEVLIRVEAPHILALGKRLAALLKVQQKAAQAKKSVSRKKPSTSQKANTGA